MSGQQTESSSQPTHTTIPTQSTISSKTQSASTEESESDDNHGEHHQNTLYPHTHYDSSDHYGSEYSDYGKYSDLEGIFNAEEVDVVYVTAPGGLKFRFRFEFDWELISGPDGTNFSDGQHFAPANERFSFYVPKGPEEDKDDFWQSPLWDLTDLSESDSDGSDGDFNFDGLDFNKQENENMASSYQISNNFDDFGSDQGPGSYDIFDIPSADNDFDSNHTYKFSVGPANGKYNEEIQESSDYGLPTDYNATCKLAHFSAPSIAIFKKNLSSAKNPLGALEILEKFGKTLAEFESNFERFSDYCEKDALESKSLF